MKSTIRVLVVAAGVLVSTASFAQKTAAPPPMGSASSPAGTTTAPPPMPAPAAKSKSAAMPPKAKSTDMAAGGGAGKVWVNSKSKTYHCEGTKYYGKTKAGEYMTEADAKTQGNHADHGKACATK